MFTKNKSYQAVNSRRRTFFQRKNLIKPVYRGAASFYIVTISTLILVVLATSFATVILAEIIRSSNDDLAQSAYDSAMAGVEEAKLAYTNYHNCINLNPSLANVDSLNNSTDEVTCQDIVYWMEHPDCDMVAHILGRIGKESRPSSTKGDAVGEVNLEQTANGKTGDLDQAYTCVEIYPNAENIYDNLSSASPYKIIKLKTDVAASVDSIILRWHMNEEGSSFVYSNIIDNEVAFSPTNQINTPVPPTISFEIIQTPDTGFTLDQLNGSSIDNTTNRSTMFFVPTGEKELAKSSNQITNSSTYIGIYDEGPEDEGVNYLSASQIASNNNQGKNYPYLVYCDNSGLDDFACSVEMELPQPIDGARRSNYTFAFIVSLPYSKPTTTFSVDFTCNGSSCSFANDYNGGGSKTVAIETNQVVIDSTGRAGDMYKRVEVRLDTELSAVLNGYPFYAIQADTINKNIGVNNEWGISDQPSPAPEPEPEPEDSTIDLTPKPCKLAIGEITSYTDPRDGNVYPVAGFPDGSCWMTRNLRFNFATHGNKITAENTNNPTKAFINSAKSNPASKKDITDSLVNSLAYSAINLGGTDCPSGNCDEYGVYYNWFTATAGNGNNNTEGSKRVNGDLCPAGFRLPTYEDVNSLMESLGWYDSVRNLDSAGHHKGYYFNETISLLGPPFDFNLPGLFFEDNGGYASSGRGRTGMYWTSTPRSKDSSTSDNIHYADILSIGRYGIETVGMWRSGGLPIRCMRDDAL